MSHIISLPLLKDKTWDLECQPKLNSENRENHYSKEKGYRALTNDYYGVATA